MSKTLSVNFRGRNFWAYEVASSVFLKFLIDAAVSRPTLNSENWLAESIQHWRVNAVFSDFGLYLNDDWSPEQVDIVIELCRNAMAMIRTHREISGLEIESWQILDDQCIFLRGHDVIPCEPVARLGDAIIALLNGTLPQLPAHHWWFYSLDENAAVMRGTACTLPVRRMTATKYDRNNPDDWQFENRRLPSWPDVENAIRRMDNDCFPIVELSCNDLLDDDNFCVIGGAGQIALFHKMDRWQYEDPNGGNSEVRLWDSDPGIFSPQRHGFFCKERNVLTDVEKVLRIVKAFYYTGTHDGLNDVQ